MFDILSTACFLNNRYIYLLLFRNSNCMVIRLKRAINAILYKTLPKNGKFLQLLIVLIDVSALRNWVQHTQASKPLAKALWALANALSKNSARRRYSGITQKSLSEPKASSEGRKLQRYGLFFWGGGVDRSCSAQTLWTGPLALFRALSNGIKERKSMSVFEALK